MPLPVRAGTGEDTLNNLFSHFVSGSFWQLLTFMVFTLRVNHESCQKGLPRLGLSTGPVAVGECRLPPLAQTGSS